MRSFHSANRPLLRSISKNRPTNQAIRHKHQNQVSAEIILEEKADCLKFDLYKLIKVRSRPRVHQLNHSTKRKNKLDI